MIRDATIYKPTVAWNTYIRNVRLFLEQTVDDPAEYLVRVVPVDINDPGGDVADKAVGYYIIDYVGHIYKIIEINIGGDGEVIKVSDDFRWGQCPQSGQKAVLFKSVGRGTAPYIAPTYLKHLSRSVVLETNSIEHDILYRQFPGVRRVGFDNFNSFSIINWENDLIDIDGSTFNPKELYGQDPKFEVWQDNLDNTFSKQQTEPFITRNIDGEIVSIDWSKDGSGYKGYIIISK